MADLHPALRPYSVGQLTAIHWITQSGQRKSAHGKVIKFVQRDGQQFMFMDRADKVDEHNKPAKLAVSADAIQRAMDADVAERQPAPAELATDKQVAYALDLIEQLGHLGWHNSGPGQMLSQPTEADLKAMSKTYISDLISELVAELGYDR